MQDTLPEVIDVAKEPQSIRDLYGLDDEATSGFLAGSVSPPAEWQKLGFDLSKWALAVGTPEICRRNLPTSALPLTGRLLAC